MSTLSVDVPVLSRPKPAAAVVLTPELAVARQARNQTLDAARAVAACALVWIHTAQSSLSRFHVLGRFGTAFFVLAAVFFLFHRLSSSPPPPYGTYALKRFRRLYIPFLAWSLIYLLIRDVKRHFLHESLLDVPFTRLLAGTSMQFWFLPFIFIATVVCFPLARRVQRMGHMKLLLAAFALAAGVSVAFLPRPVASNDVIADYFLYSIWIFTPSIFFAIGLGIIYSYLPPKVRTSPFLALAGILLTASCILSLWLLRNTGHPLPALPRNLAGIGWLMVALVPYRGRLVRFLAPLGQYSYGIFLVHPLFVSSLQSLASTLHIPAAAWLDILVVAIAYPASALLTAILRSQRWTRWLVP